MSGRAGTLATSVSIVTPVCNGERYIEALVESVRRQDQPDLEHIVIDDGSQDATRSVLARFPHLRAWSRENRGQYATMNEGLRAATGGVVCFISADDVMAPRAVTTALAALARDPSADWVYGDYGCIDAAGRPLFPLRPFRHAPTRFYPFSLHISHSSLYVRRSALLQNDLWFDETLRYTGDYDWIVRLLRAPLRVLRVPEVLSHVRLHEQQATNRHFAAMRRESLAVQRRLHIPSMPASLGRKILFGARIVDTARRQGLRHAWQAVRTRLET